MQSGINHLRPADPPGQLTCAFSMGKSWYPIALKVFEGF